MLLLLTSVSLAGPRIVSVGEAILVDEPGNWPRIFPREDGGWSFLTANQSGLLYTGLDAAFAREDGTRYQLVADTDLIDHAYATCPDGTVLHVGMGTRASEQHTAVLRRFAVDWTLLSTNFAIDDDPEATIVDQAAVCGETFQGFSYLHAGELNDEGDATVPEARFFRVDAADAPLGEHLIAEVFNPTGMSLLERDGQLHAITSNIPQDGSLRVVTLDSALTPVDDRQIPVAASPAIVYWPQGVVDVGGHAFVAYITQADPGAWTGQFGDVRLVQFDEDWNVVGDTPIYVLGPGYGGFQPGLARRDDELVVTFTLDSQQNALVVVTLDTTDVDPDTGDPDTGPTDTGPTDTGPTDTDPTDTDDTDTAAEPDTDDSAADSPAEDTGAGAPTDGSGCGCASNNALPTAWVAILGLAFARGARRRGA